MRATFGSSNATSTKTECAVLFVGNNGAGKVEAQRCVRGYGHRLGVADGGLSQYYAIDTDLSPNVQIRFQIVHST